MKKYRFVSLILIPSLIFMNFIPTAQVSAGKPMAFGEIRSTGNVLIESSTGQWMEMQETSYPLIKNTKLRTRDGIVSITTSDGSKIDLSKDTEAAINALNGGYTVSLTKGNVSFNITPSITLTITTPHVTVSAIPNPANIQGIVICSDKGTEVRSISGKINVSYRGLVQPRGLNTGEGLFVSAAGEAKKLMGAVVPATGKAGGPKLLTKALLIGTLVTAGIVIALQAFREEEERVASPAAP
jgi:hypothetical protein